MKLKLGLSPCPNDTFMFDALLNRRIEYKGLDFESTFADIAELNRSARDHLFDVCKVSYAAVPDLMQHYKVLNTGSAMGFGNGPLIVAAREDVDLSDPGLRILLPGEDTTANMLVDKLYSHLKNRHYCHFASIMKRVASGEFDAGVIIHEGRFTYHELGLKMLVDLGVEWEKYTGLPLPLGAIVVSRKLSTRTQKKIERLLGESIRFAMVSPDASQEFVRSHAQELSQIVISKHISLYVNRFSIDLGEQGKRAIMQLLGLPDESCFL